LKGKHFSLPGLLTERGRRNRGLGDFARSIRIDPSYHSPVFDLSDLEKRNPAEVSAAPFPVRRP
jgi:hypothetical protein